MSDPGFLSRWSRRKSAAVRPEAAVAEVSEAELPAIESLGAASDYTAFLRAGVSRVVQTRALGIAWASDPVIAGFRGMAEYDWDFNAVGYGRLAAGDNVAALLRQILTPIETAPEPAAPDAPVAEPPVMDNVRAPELRVAAAPEPEVEAEVETPAPRRHGGALPV